MDLTQWMRTGRSKSRDTNLPVTRVGERAWLSWLALGVIVALAAFLRLYQLGAFSTGNLYYAAAVKSMLTSWHNFFFVAFEPGGSVSVDKPPLGLWVEAFSAALLGVNGFALALPNALAGTLSVPLLYMMVRRPFGAAAGLVASLALAVTPVAVAVERNNTMDGLLVFVLLLTTWAVLRAVRSGRFRFLLLAAFLLGLGFNIKMLQAYMILPALVLVYACAAPHPWGRRILHLLGALAVLLVVSLSWAVAVDWTPATQRPYVGSSTDNTVFELIVGHNGISRLVGRFGLAGARADDDSPTVAQPQPNNGGPAAVQPRPNDGGGRLRLPQGGNPPSGRDNAGSGQPFQEDAPGGLPNGFPNGAGGADGVNGGGFAPGGRNEVGQAGWLRLFTQPLVEEAGWLLPLALLAIPLAAFVPLRLRPGGEASTHLLLWSAWLLPVMAYFSFTSGLFHAYYLVMLGPPLAALAGIALWALGRVQIRQHWLAWALAAGMSAAALVLQWTVLREYPDYRGLIAFAAAAWLAGVAWLIWKPTRLTRGMALACLSVALLAAPLVWSATVTFDPYPDTGLPNANQLNDRPSLGNGGANQQPNPELLSFLLENAPQDGYLLATLSAQQAAPYILATGRAVLTFGGFTGSDNVIDAAGLAKLVIGGRLRYVLGGELERSKPELGTWVRENCSPVSLPGAEGAGFGAAGQFYDCAPR